MFGTLFEAMYPSSKDIQSLLQSHAYTPPATTTIQPLSPDLSSFPTSKFVDIKLSYSPSRCLSLNHQDMTLGPSNKKKKGETLTSLASTPFRAALAPCLALWGVGVSYQLNSGVVLCV